MPASPTSPANNIISTLLFLSSVSAVFRCSRYKSSSSKSFFGRRQLGVGNNTNLEAFSVCGIFLNFRFANNNVFTLFHSCLFNLFAILKCDYQIAFIGNNCCENGNLQQQLPLCSFIYERVHLYGKQIFYCFHINFNSFFHFRN